MQKTPPPATTTMSIRAPIITSALLPLLLLAAASSADQPTCRAIWLFQLPCSEPRSALVTQVKAWSTRECYGSQEQCMYEIIKNLPTYLEIKHTSRTNKTTAIIFEFLPPAASAFCKMRARATTMTQKAKRPNDYCLLHNLITGSGLSHAEGYREICTETMCPSKRSATCSAEG